MAEAFEIEEIEERVILVGVSEQDGDDAEDSVAELAELVKTAGAIPVGTLIQKREMRHPGTYIGTGKVEELAELIQSLDATGIVCDDELSPAQLKNLEDMLDTKVMDRTLVILDIFAARANTSEGKIQVELAQLKYRLGRLAGLGRSMSRLGGGIGTRGPGEKKLEMDRRLIKDRIAQLNRELKEVRMHREVTRAQHEKNGKPVAAIVGYTNAGKSTLLKIIMQEYTHSIISTSAASARIIPVINLLFLFIFISPFPAPSGAICHCYLSIFPLSGFMLASTSRTPFFGFLSSHEGLFQIVLLISEAYSS